MQTPAQVAKRANITAQSVRNYSRDYADLLSPGASGEAGPRLYTDEDVRILCTIAALRKAGVPHEEIVARMEREDVPPIVDVTPQSPQNSVVEGLKAPSNDPSNLVTSYQMALNARFEGIERRMNAVNRQRDLLLIGTGVWIGIMATGFLIWVLWLAER